MQNMSSSTIFPKNRALPRLSIDSTLSRYQRSSVSSISSLSSSTRASIALSIDSSVFSDGDGFFALSIYDFDAADRDQLSFRSDELLEIVKQEDSGWWAAIRVSDLKVGWIPSAYVERISDEEAEELLIPTERQQLLEVFENGAGQIYGAEVVADYRRSPYVVTPGKGYEWMPMLNNGDKLLPPTPHTSGGEREDFLNDMTSPLYGPLVSSSPGAEQRSPGQELILSASKSTRYGPCPPSPSIPPPTPPPKTAPLRSNSEKREPTTPRRSHSNPLTSSAKLSSPGDSVSPFQARYVRRRPLLINDQVSLQRLSVLLETQSIEDIEDICGTPAAVETSEPGWGSTRVHTSRASVDKVKRITGDDEAQALYEAMAAQASYPWFLRPVYNGEEIKVEYDGTITNGTLGAIVERLTLEPLNPSHETKLRHVFLSTFRTMGTADEIFDLLLERYDLDAPQTLTTVELEEWRTKRLLPTQRRVISIFTAWLVNHNMIGDDPPIARRLQEFLSEISGPADNLSMANQAMKTLECLTFSVPISPVTPVKPHKRRRTKDAKNELLRMDPTVLAEHLCLHEYRYYSKVRPQEGLNWIKTRTGESVANLLAFCALHDKLAAWVKHSILWTDGLGRRADVIELWIKIAEKCRAMHNYSSMSAITTALSSTVISRLHLTWAHVGRSSHLEPLKRFNEPAGNFSAFRHAQQSLDVPCIPFIGMYLTDIVHINDQYMDSTVSTNKSSSEKLFSFVKRRKWSDALDAMLYHQKKQYPYVEETTIMKFIETNLKVSAEKEPSSFWDRSHEVQQGEVASADIRKGLEAAGF